MLVSTYIYGSLKPFSGLLFEAYSRNISTFYKHFILFYVVVVKFVILDLKQHAKIFFIIIYSEVYVES